MRWRPFRGIFGLDPKPDVADELSFHLEMRIRELVAKGFTPERARQLALQRFGDYRANQRDCVAIDERRGRRMNLTTRLKELRQDIAYAGRMLRRTPGFTVVAVGTLALGIGANSAIFSVVHAVLLQALPFQHAERLYDVRTVYPDGTPYSLSAPDFVSLRENQRVFDGVEAYSPSALTLTGSGEPREVQAVGVTDGLISMLGLRVASGRAFQLSDHQPGQNNAVILDDGFWKRQFGADPSVVGRTVSLGGRSLSIVGILAPGAKVPVAAELYVPLQYDDNFKSSNSNSRRSEFLAVVGRAKSGQLRTAIDADVRRVGTALQEWFPQTNGGLTFGVIPVRQVLLGDVETPLLVLLGAVGFVLLVACANVANLLLARASARQQEMAVRAALGAGRGRLIRQLITESVMLGLLGGALGLGLAFAGTQALIAAQPADIPRLAEVGVNSKVVLFTLTISLLTGLIFGTLPAFLSTGRVLNHALVAGGRGGSANRRGHRIRSGLVVAEMGLAVVLLMGAGLLIRSFIALTLVPTGFVADRAVSFRMSLQGPAYRAVERVGAQSAEIERRLGALPGVSAVALSSALPYARGSMVDFAVEGAPPPPANINAEIGLASVTPEYFTAVGVPLKRGRIFTTSDTAEAPIVAVANETAVRLWFPDRDPLGQFVLAANGRRRQIVGIVSDVRPRDRRLPAAPQLYVPYAQRVVRSMRVIVRTNGDPMTLAPAIRSTVGAIDRDIAIVALAPMTQLVNDSVARPRFYTTLLALFAAVALALAATGIFGVMSYAVAQRSREISIRMALGAGAGNVVGMIVGRAMRLAAGGVVVGIAAALLLGKTIQTQLYGVSVFDPVTLAGVTVVLAVSAAAASLLPAWRAASLDPGSTLRQG